jgi:hypothetical protein
MSMQPEAHVAKSAQVATAVPGAQGTLLNELRSVLGTKLSVLKVGFAKQLGSRVLRAILLNHVMLSLSSWRSLEAAAMKAPVWFYILSLEEVTAVNLMLTIELDAWTAFTILLNCDPNVMPSDPIPFSKEPVPPLMHYRRMEVRLLGTPNSTANPI